MEAGGDVVKRGWRKWLKRNSSTVIALIVCVVVITAVLGLVIYPWAYQKGTQEGAERYEAKLATQAEELRVEENEELAKKDQKIYELEQQLRPVDEEGILEDRMYEFYGRHAPDMLPALSSDEEFREYCRQEYPKAVYPATEWTAAEVIAAWTEQPEIWGYYAGPEARCHVWFTWTVDYAHCFILDPIDPGYWLTDDDTGEHLELKSGWLVVDGVRVAMLDKETYDIDDPYELIRQYQAGEWDGKIRRSHDGSTTVQVGYSYTTKARILEYSSEIWLYDERFDPEGLAWTEFETLPWWKQQEMSPELLAATGRDEMPAAEPWERVNVKGSAHLYLGYLPVDLPSGYDMSELNVVERTREGLLCVEGRKPVLYSKGAMVQEWNMRFFDDWMEFIESPRNPSGEYADYVGFVYDRSEQRLVALCVDGSTETVLDKVVLYKNGRDELWGFKDGEFMCWRLGSYDINAYRFGTDVTEVDVSLPVIMLAKSDGACYMMAYGDDDAHYYVAKQLGTEPLAYYHELYKMLGSGHYIII